MRSPENEARYQAVLAQRDPAICPLCAIPSRKEFEHWRLVENDFPYDLVASVHHMLIPKRHAIERELSAEEWEEFNRIKHGYANEHYAMMFEGMAGQHSVPSHFHVHLVVLKEQ